MGILALSIGMCGCNKATKPAIHKLSELTAVSVSCESMNFSYSYSFWLHLENGNWLFDAECFIHKYEEQVVFNDHIVADKDVEKCLEILNKGNLIEYAEHYKKPEKSPFVIMDETIFGFGLTFSDGKRYSVSGKQSELEALFYSLAESLDAQQND